MRVEWAQDGKGDLQFIIYAQNPEERLIMKVFRDQLQTQQFFNHGFTYESGAYGPSAFNFGSVKSNKRILAKGGDPMAVKKKAPKLGFEIQVKLSGHLPKAQVQETLAAIASVVNNQLENGGNGGV